MTNRVVWGGRYAVFDELASGGMASVFLACRLVAGDSGRVVAIKKMFESFAKRPELVTMFLDEAHIAARIRHPNVVTTWEFLRVPDSLAIVMEFVLGSSLVDLHGIMAERGTVAPVPVTAAVVHDVLEGLHAAHETTDEHGAPFGLVHRDVSPHNVLVGKDGVARIIDFGIAKAAGRLQVTDVGVMKGKLAYMAPEQIRAAAIDRRVDLYSVGVVLWESLTGSLLFQGPNELEQFALRGAGTVKVAPPSSVNPKLSPALDAVVLRALAVDPERRFATAREMADALEAASMLASPADVAAWVVGLAGSKIRELETMRNEVEASYASGELAGLSGAPASAAKADRLAAPPASADFAVPDLVPQPRSSKPALAAPGPAPPMRQASTSSSSSYEDAFDVSGPSDLRLDLEVPALSRPRLSSPSLDPQSRSVPVRASYGQARSFRESPPRRSSRGRVFLGALVVLGALGLALARVGPDSLRSAVVAGAARRGLTLTVDHVAARSGGLALEGVTVTLAGVSDLTLQAPEVEVALDWQGSVQRVDVPGYEVFVRGNVLDVAARIAAWRKESHAAVACEAKAGHIAWADAVVPGASIEGLDASLAIAADGDAALHLEVPSVTMPMAHGRLGPWRAVLDSTSEETKLNVALDRTKPAGPPNLSLVARPNLGTVVGVTLPRAKLSQLGIPGALVQAGDDAEIDLAMEGQVPPAGERLKAHGKLTIFSMPRPMPGAPPADVVMEGAIEGTPPQTLRIESGQLTIGKAKAPLRGEVAFAEGGLRLEVDRPYGRGPLPPPFVLDTREWTRH